jgi:hypothetical protein
MNQAQTLQSVGFDISLLSDNAAPVEKSHTVTVLFDDEGNHKAGFEIVSKNSEQYRTVIRETSVNAIKRSVQKNKQIDAKTDDGAGQLYDLGENRSMHIAMAVVIGLPGFVDKGVPVPVTEQFLKGVFAKFPSWQDKILQALESEANFLTV